MENPFIKVEWEDVAENFTPERIKRVKTYFQTKYNTTHVQVITKTLSQKFPLLEARISPMRYLRFGLQCTQ